MNKENNEISEAKALRWLCNQFPIIEDPEDEIDKMNNIIHLYCEAGANKIEALNKELEELKASMKGVKNISRTKAEMRLLEYLDNNCNKSFSMAGWMNESEGVTSEWLKIKQNVIKLYESAFDCLGRWLSIDLINDKFKIHNIDFKFIHSSNDGYVMLLRK